MSLRPRPFPFLSRGRDRAARPDLPPSPRRRRRLAGLLLLTLSATSAAAAVNAAPAVAFDVAADGSAQFTSVQAAVNAAVAAGAPATVRIHAGTYRETVRIPAGAPPMELAGDGPERTVIVFGNHAALLDPASGRPFGTFGSATVAVDADDFRARDLTIANDAGPVGQAVALRLSGTRAAFRHVHLRGHQDTLYLQGRDSLAWFGDCAVEGTVDFIFGAGTALFERCRIHSLGDGYVTAAATPHGRRFGLVFRDCRLTAAPGVRAVYLGRPWRDHARVAFLDSVLGAHVLPAGWHDWDRPERRATAHFAEAGNTGPGADAGARAPWAHRLGPRQAAAYSRQAILGDWRPYE